MNLLEAIHDKNLFGRFFHDTNSWRAWHACLAALFALPMAPDELDIYKQCTGRQTPPAAPKTPPANPKSTGQAPAPQAPAAQAGLVDINSASEANLQTLSGIGPARLLTKARRPIRTNEARRLIGQAPATCAWLEIARVGRRVTSVAEHSGVGIGVLLNCGVPALSLMSTQTSQLASSRASWSSRKWLSRDSVR